MMHNCNGLLYFRQSVGSPETGRKKPYLLKAHRPIDLLFHTLVYDRDCELCRWAQGIVLRWDRHGRIRYLAFQDPDFGQWFPDDDLDAPPKAMLFIDGQGRVWEGFEAVRRMLPHLPWGRPLALLLYLPGVPWVAMRLYEWVAKNRYRFFGKTGI